MIVLLCKNLRKSFKSFTHEQDVQEVRQRTELFNVTLLGFLVSRGRAAMIVLADSNEFWTNSMWLVSLATASMLYDVILWTRSTLQVNAAHLLIQSE